MIRIQPQPSPTIINIFTKSVRRGIRVRHTQEEITSSQWVQNNQLDAAIKVLDLSSLPVNEAREAERLIL